LRIALAVHGRFHAFELAIGLLEAGHDVTVFTNYPARVAARFGVPADRVIGHPGHGAAARVAHRIASTRADAWINPWFGRWAARRLAEQQWDVVHIWSGVAAEWLDQPDALRSRCVIARGSAHIRTQRNLLDEEERRSGARLDKPSDWIIEREEKEYARAALVVVPSRFAYESFIERGVPSKRMRLVPLAAAPTRFRAPQEVIAERVARSERREPLRVLFVGAITYQKGVHDLLQVMETVPHSRFQFRLVGPLARECKPILARLAKRAEIAGKVSEPELTAHYAWADLLVLPSIQDGFAVVLSQAAASGVPFVATDHSGGPDLVAAGVPSWIVPARSPRHLSDQLLDIEEDRADLSAKVAIIQKKAVARDWCAVAHDFVRETST
jgi:glycosyltransferase involved in cell wall biosynthesis